METVIEVSGVTFSHGGPPVLRDIDLRVERAGFLGIVGPNGGGKTTLLRIILGLLRPQRGTVSIFGQAPAAFREWGRVGYVPQGVSHLDTRFPATVAEVVATGRFGRVGLFRRLSGCDKAAVADALRTVDLADRRNDLIGRLSGGQLQRVFIARALAGQPDLLILDEPTVGVDAPAQEAFYGLLRRLNRDLGLTVILVSHDIGVVTAEVSHLACVNGRLVFHGSPGEFLSDTGLAGLYHTGVRVVGHGH